MNQHLASISLCSLLAASAVALPLVGGPSEASDERLERLERWTEEVSPQVEELRGLEFKQPVEVEIATAEDFRAYAQKQLAKMGSEGEREALELAAKMLGLFPAEEDFWEAMIGLLTGQVGGYYDPDTKSFSMMEGVEGALAKQTLSHELVHALEDQHFGLGETLEELSFDSDRAAAFHAVAEGTATLVANRWLLENFSQFSLDEILELTEAAEQQELFQAAPVLWLPTVFSYLGGQTFLHASHSLMAAQLQPFDEERLNRAFLEPPVSTEQVLHPEKYWDAEAIDLPEQLAIAPLEGWVVLEDDTLGEVVLSLVARGDGFEAPDPEDGEALYNLRFTVPASEGWGGDRWQLLASGDARALALATSWDTEDDRDEWHAALEAQLETLRKSAATLADGGPSSVSLRKQGPRLSLLVVLTGTGTPPLTSEARALVDLLEVTRSAGPPSDG
ncbi:MAG: hypothetical protein AAFZ65_13060 [Planctomycetota bacterium]